MKHLCSPGVEISSNSHANNPLMYQISEMGRAEDILEELRAPPTQIQSLARLELGQGLFEFTHGRLPIAWRGKRGKIRAIIFQGTKLVFSLHPDL